MYLQCVCELGVYVYVYCLNGQVINYLKLATESAVIILADTTCRGVFLRVLHSINEMF